MDFIKRLGFYLVGLSIGIVFLTIFLKKKSDETGVYFCYFPNCRTLKDIRSKPMYYAAEVTKKMTQYQLDSLDIKYILTEGDVDFSKSDTKSVPCKTYIVASELKDKQWTFTVRNCSNKATLQQIDVQ